MGSVLMRPLHSVTRMAPPLSRRSVTLHLGECPVACAGPLQVSELLDALLECCHALPDL